MKKTIAIVVAIAILGGLGAYSITRNNTPDNVSQTAGANVSPTPASNTGSSTATNLKDGSFTGSRQDTAYGPVQVAAVVSGGKITDIKYLQMPEDRGESTDITNRAEPLLKNSTINKQTAHVDFVSGATITSQAYEQSLQAALDQAVQS